MRGYKYVTPNKEFAMQTLEVTLADGRAFKSQVPGFPPVLSYHRRSFWDGIADAVGLPGEPLRVSVVWPLAMNHERVSSQVYVRRGRATLRRGVLRGDGVLDYTVPGVEFEFRVTDDFAS